VSESADTVRPETDDESPPAPVATWESLAPEADWCPASLAHQLGHDFIESASVEPRILHRHTSEWHVRGASVRGRAHAHRGEYRDDAIACASTASLLVLAVADGAGSSPLSRIGAAVTAQTAVDRVVSRFLLTDDADAKLTTLGTAMAHAVYDASLTLHALAAAHGCGATDFRTTLILVAICGDDILVSQVGDGAAIVQTRAGDVLRASTLRESAWAGEVHCFIPEPCASAQAAAIRHVRAENVELVALFSDGIDDPFHPLEQSGTAIAEQWRHGTEHNIGAAIQSYRGPVLDSTESLLDWLQFEQRGEVDDRSLIVAWRAEAT
jgi:hypothetical protein